MPDLTHLKPGDKIALRNRANSLRSHIPLVSHELFTITKTTPTQIAAKNEHGHEARFRRKDGAKLVKATSMRLKQRQIYWKSTRRKLLS